MSFIACELRIKISATNDAAIDRLIALIRNEGESWPKDLLEVRIFETNGRAWVQ